MLILSIFRKHTTYLLINSNYDNSMSLAKRLLHRLIDSL